MDVIADFSKKKLFYDDVPIFCRPRIRHFTHTGNLVSRLCNDFRDKSDRVSRLSDDFLDKSDCQNRESDHIAHQSDRESHRNDDITYLSHRGSQLSDDFHDNSDRPSLTSNCIHRGSDRESIISNNLIQISSCINVKFVLNVVKMGGITRQTLAQYIARIQICLVPGRYDPGRNCARPPHIP